MAAGAAIILVGSGWPQHGHFHLEGGNVVLWSADSSCLDVESLCGPGIGALGPGLAKADVEVNDSYNAADDGEDDEDEEKSFRVERERGVVFIPNSVFGLVVDHFVQVHGHQIVVLLLGFSLFQLILTIVFFLGPAHGAGYVADVREECDAGWNDDFFCYLGSVPEP